MTPATAEGGERHQAPALWLVVLALAIVTVTAAVAGALVALSMLAATLLLAAAARLIRRGRRPDGIAVRTTAVDVTVLTTLALGITVLMFTPGV